MPILDLQLPHADRKEVWVQHSSSARCSLESEKRSSLDQWHDGVAKKWDHF